MNGNRGAKGSIKDRLISMLYRMRYKKKKLKEENYTIGNKEKQNKYLYNLYQFKETENINILDSKDKKILDSVEYNANFKIKKKVGVDESKNKKVNFVDETNFIDVKLDNIESKTSELNEKVNIKKEIKKTKTEITILKEVDKFIKTSINNLDEINSEIEVIKTDLKQNNKSTEELEIKYNELKKKISKLKKQYDVIKEKYDLSDFSIIESIKIIDSIDNYKSLASLNEIEMMVRVCKNEINKIDNITVIKDESKKVGTTIEEKKKKEANIKIKFNKNKDKINAIKTIEGNLANELKEQQKIIDDMYYKASFYEKNISKKIEFVGHRKILSSLFRIAGGILTIPLTGTQIFGVALGSTMINKGLKEMNKSLEKREKMVINYKYEDISNQIASVKETVEYTNLILTDSLNEIKKLKNNFNETFKNFEYILPDYSDTLEKINALEQKLLEQQFRIEKMDKKLEQEKEINKQKLKKVGK